MTEVVVGGDLMAHNSSPEQSPQHPWPMVPVLQTLTVLSDGEEEQMEQKMGIENGFGLSVTKLECPSPASMNPLPTTASTNISSTLSSSSTNNINNNNQKRKVGRPITSVKTMNRSFPAVDEIRSKLEAGECYVRPRASSSSSDVWALFQEVAYKDNHFFTGIVQCKTCQFLTRYHGQITGTSHMRRHHCFSVLFPNSTPANRKPKQTTATTNQQNIATLTNQSSNNTRPLVNSGNSINNYNINVDADSTTPRMLKKIKKEMPHHHSSSPQSFINEFSALPPNTLHINEAVNNTTANITIHPTIPKKKFKNGSIIQNERSLISNNGIPSSPHSMLRNNNNSMNGYNSPSSSTASSPHQSSSSSPTSNGPLHNNARVNGSKQNLRERLIEFCAAELVPLKCVASESFRTILQSHLRLCQELMTVQFMAQPQLMNLVTTLYNCMNHIPWQTPDAEQLNSLLEHLYKQCRDKIRHHVNASLENNIGSALVCDSDNDACIISVYYVDNDWRLTEAILSASAMVFDINQFVSKTLETYSLHERKKFSKFTFVSHGGLFNGVSICLSSMAHIVDKVVDESLTAVDEDNSSSPLNDLFESCQELASRLNMTFPTNQYNVDWISKYELMKNLLDQHEMIVNADDYHSMDVQVDFNFVSTIVKLLEPFYTASHELRQCFRHPTLCHVLLYFYKLKKVLLQSQNIQYVATTTAVNNKKSTRKSKRNSVSGKNESDSDSTEERDIETNGDNVTNNDELETNGDNEQEEDETININLVVDRLKQSLLENLLKYYQVQSLHRIATFLWPNFRLLKMLTSEEQKEVHEDVRKLIQSRITSKTSTMTNNNNNNNNQSNILSDLNKSTSMNDRNIEIKSKSKSNFDEWEIFSDEDQDEVDKYLSVQLTSCSENFVLNWWREHSQEFPKLSQLAKWVLSIPASATTRERFQIWKNRQVDDMLLFLHCNMQTDKFDLASTKKFHSTKNKWKVRNSVNSNNGNTSNGNNYSSSLIANN